MPKSHATKLALKLVLLATLGFVAPSWFTTAFAQPDSVAIFAQKTESILITEQKLGQLALQKGTSLAVKNYGAMIAKQDGAMERSLKGAAQTVQLVLPTTSDAEEQRFYNHLSQLTGAAFDRAYATNMVQVQQSQVADFRTIAGLGPFAAINMAPIKNFAVDNLAVIEAQLQQARQMAETVGANEAGANSVAPVN